VPAQHLDGRGGGRPRTPARGRLLNRGVDGPHPGGRVVARGRDVAPVGRPGDVVEAALVVPRPQDGQAGAGGAIPDAGGAIAGAGGQAGAVGGPADGGDAGGVAFILRVGLEGGKNERADGVWRCVSNQACTLAPSSFLHSPAGLTHIPVKVSFNWKSTVRDGAGSGAVIGGRHACGESLFLMWKEVGARARAPCALGAGGGGGGGGGQEEPHKKRQRRALGPESGRVCARPRAAKERKVSER